MGMLQNGGPRTRRALGRLVYPRGVLVHRMGLALPPAQREVVTLHDVVAWRFPDEGTPIAAAAGELREAAAVVCVSESTAADAVEMFGLDNTHVVHLGVDDRFRDAMPLDALPLSRMGVGGRYLLHAGGASARKNLAALADAWRLLADRYPDVSLALSGPPHRRRTELFRDLPRVVMLGRVDRALVPGLIAGAEAVVVPSLHEGFGLPVLEAMAAGTVVVAAETSSLPEVAGGAAVLVAPTGAGIAEGVAAVLDGDIDRSGLLARGRARASEFTWERCAAEHAAIWNDAAR
ncbi:glycosyltransferase family 4 protein [Humibacter sp.]|uniref:glycosyltransferase family 4 protein n=1 Tax=Humibacter sp. TaxID=1940291 RepID=UPI003F7DC342